MIVRLVMTCFVVFFASSTPAAADDSTSVQSDAPNTWLALADEIAAVTEVGDTAPAPQSEAPAGEGPPIPFHTIEGVSGGLITPMAYLCNTGAKGSTYGMPSIAYTYIALGEKNLHVVSVIQTFFERFELGYAFNSLSLGNLPHDLKRRGLDNGPDNVQLHHFNARVLLIPEDSFNLPLPAITVGAHFKYNQGVRNINKSLGNALDSLGYDTHYGMDFTLTATKMFPTLGFGRPVILTAGMRNSRSSHLGLLGFGDSCSTTVEGSIAYLPIDNLVLVYEFRQKNNPYDRLAKLIDREHNWHAFSASWIVNDRLTVTGVYGIFGNVLNARSDCSLGVQVKYEF